MTIAIVMQPIAKPRAMRRLSRPGFEGAPSPARERETR